MISVMEKIWLSSPHMSGKEQKYIQLAFDTNWIAPLGENVDGFESDICQYTGVRATAAVNSGTAALHLALILAGVVRGDVVICQSLTFSASANPIVYLGATPVFVDSETHTWNMCPEALETAILDCRNSEKIRAIVVVHLYGMPAEMDAINYLAQRYDIPVIEDAAEALGSRYKEKSCGALGRFGVLSFNGNKIITTSGGGAILSDDEKIIAKAKFLSTQARDPAPHFEHSQIGYNYRLSNVLAGIGRGQMEVLADRVIARRAINKKYRQNLSSFSNIEFQTEPGDQYYSNYWLTTLLIRPVNQKNILAEKIRMALHAENIEARPLWKPMHLQPVFSGSPYYGGGVAARLFEQGLCLPSSSNLKHTEIDRITIIMKSILTCG